jgi:hypothetical protein
MKNLLLYPFLFLLLFAACNDRNPANDAMPSGSTNRTDSWIHSTAQNPDDQKNNPVDAQNGQAIPAANNTIMTRPDLTVKKLLEYASKGETDSVKALCDPQAEKDPQSLCAGGQATIGKLAHAALSPDPVNIMGSTATVGVIYNPDAKGTQAQKAMVRMHRIDKLWYVVRMESFKLNNQ